jgi:5-methylthioadenosine/S-adenosylhomocysteine deaminase
MILKGEQLLNGDGTLLHDGALLVEGGVIRAVGPAEELSARHPSEDVLDWGRVLLTPGFVNGHAHSFQSLLRGLGDDLDFFSWRDQVLYPSAAWLTPEDLETGALWAFAEMLRAGTTTVAEFFYVHDQGNANAERVIEAARRVGIRLFFGRALYTGERAPSRYREPPAESLARLDDLAQRHAEPWLTVAPAPHSLHAASAEAIALAAEWARAHGTVYTMHVAEGRYEVEELQARTGQGVAEYLDRLGALGPHAVLVHGVHLSPADLDLVALRQARVVHNPGANAFLGDGVAPLLALDTRGVVTCLGTDGGCTNNRLSLLDEMRLAVLLQRALGEDGSLVGAPRAFAMATQAAGEVFRLPVGRLAPGYRADVVALSLDDLSLLGSADLLASVVYAAGTTAVRHVMVEGKVVVRDGRVLGIDVAELKERIRAALARAEAHGMVRPRGR